jgi:hypothetical protein
MLVPYGDIYARGRLLAVAFFPLREGFSSGVYRKLGLELAAHCANPKGEAGLFECGLISPIQSLPPSASTMGFRRGVLGMILSAHSPVRRRKRCSRAKRSEVRVESVVFFGWWIGESRVLRTTLGGAPPRSSYWTMSFGGSTGLPNIGSRAGWDPAHTHTACVEKYAKDQSEDGPFCGSLPVSALGLEDRNQKSWNAAGTVEPVGLG